jgi:hypothetical protein
MKKQLLLIILALFTATMSAQDWSLAGNAGTNPATDFLGTTDGAPLVLRVNNVRSGLIDEPSRSSFFGRNTGVNNTYVAGLMLGLENAAFGDGSMTANTHGSMNAALGARSLRANTTGDMNLALGINALGTNTTGSSNSGVGSWALDENTTGGSNTAVGVLALSGNTIGSYNVAMGASALTVNKAGSRAVAIGADAMRYANGTTSAFNNLNVAIGYQAMHGSSSLTANTGNRNTAVGYQSLVDYTTGGDNTALGTQALLNATTGSTNTAVGSLALSILSTGSNNTGVGRNANISTGTLNNATAIGYNSSANASNKVRLGNSSVTVVEGQVAYTNPSDARFKNAVREDVQGLALILKLRPVSYTFDRLAFAKHVHEDTDGREGELAAASEARTVGFLAQEVEKTVDELHFTAFDAVHAPENPTDNYGLAYAQFVVPLVKAVQELHAENDELRAELERMRTELLDRVEKIENSALGTDREQRPGVLHVFPDPANEMLQLEVPAASVGRPAMLELLDAAGKKVIAQQEPALPAIARVDLPATLQGGVYVLVLRVEGHSPRSASVIVQR